jgi:DNA-dependent RNA polymerase auxiliary subunit epsilon
MFPILDKFNLEPNLHKTQNLYFEISMENKKRPVIEQETEWVSYFNQLGANLGVKVE